MTTSSNDPSATLDEHQSQIRKAGSSEPSKSWHFGRIALAASACSVLAVCFVFVQHLSHEQAKQRWQAEITALQAENGALGEGIEMALWRRTVSQAVLMETLRELGRSTAEVEASRAEPGVGSMPIPAEVDKSGWENLKSSDVVEAIYSELVTTRRALADAHQQVSEITSRESVSASP